jgi:hypothetical protein
MFIFYIASRPCLGHTLPPKSMSTEASFPGLKRLCAKVGNEWSYIFTPPYSFMAYTGIILLVPYLLLRVLYEARTCGMWTNCTFER